MATAAVLLVLDGCDSDAHKSEGKPRGGRLTGPPEATTEPTVTAPRSGDFVMDVQTHFLDQNHDVPNLGVAFPQNACGEQDGRDCFTVDKYLDLLFNKSDTNMIVISALPYAGSTSARRPSMSARSSTSSSNASPSRAWRPAARAARTSAALVSMSTTSSPAD